MRRTPKKSQLAVFYALTITVGVIICVAVFGIVWNFVRSDNQSPSPAAIPPLLAGNDVMGSAAASLRLSQSTGVVTSINASERRMRIIDADTREALHITVSPEAEVLNRSRNEISLSGISIGDIIDTRFDPDTYTADTVVLSPSAWEHRQIRQLQVYPDRMAIGIGINSFNYDDETLVIYHGHSFNIERINPVDVVTARGIRSQLLFVEVHRAHGTLQLNNIDAVEGGTIEVNTSIFRQLNDAEEVLLLEGLHRVVVRGDNIEPFVREIVVSQGETVTLDLADVQFRNSTLVINVNAENYTILIDDEAATSPFTSTIGSEVQVFVSAPGYVPFLQMVNLQQPNVILNVELQRPVEMSLLVINTIPTGANVFVNNALVGISPISYLVPQGQASVTITMQGFENWANQFIINQARQEYQISLTPTSPFPTASPNAPQPPPPQTTTPPGQQPAVPITPSAPAAAPPPPPMSPPLPPANPFQSPPAQQQTPQLPPTPPAPPTPPEQPSSFTPPPAIPFPDPQVFDAPPPLPAVPPPPPPAPGVQPSGASTNQFGGAGIRFSEIEEFRHE